MKEILSLLIVLSFILSCGNNGNNHDNTLNSGQNPDSDTKHPALFPNVPVAKLPFTISWDELTKAKQFNIDNQQITSAILDSLKNKYIKRSDVKLVLNIPVKKNFELYIASVKEDWQFEDKMTNYFLITFSNEGEILAVSKTLQDFSEVEGEYIQKLFIDYDEQNHLIETDYIDAEPGMSVDNLDFTQEEKDEINFFLRKTEINDEGKFIRVIKSVTQKNEPVEVYEGTIAGKEVIFELFNEYNNSYVSDVFGKFRYKNDENEVLLGNYRVPVMTYLMELSVLTLSGSRENNNFTFIPFSDKLLGRYDDAKTVKLIKTDKSYDELLPQKHFSNISNPDFKEFLSHFAYRTTKEGIATNAMDLVATEFTKLKENDLKFIDLSLLREDFSRAKFCYGYVYEIDSAIVCILPVESTLNDKPFVQYGIIEFTNSGKIKSFDILNKLPNQPQIRVYVPDKDYEPYYFKNMLEIPMFSNENFNKLRVYVDLPAGYKDVGISVAQQMEGESEPKIIFENPEVPFAPNCPRISVFDIEGNFGCNNLIFTLYSIDGANLKSYTMEMHCGE
jgi:hypothetical protein